MPIYEIDRVFGKRSGFAWSVTVDGQHIMENGDIKRVRSANAARRHIEEVKGIDQVTIPRAVAVTARDVLTYLVDGQLVRLPMTPETALRALDEALGERA